MPDCLKKLTFRVFFDSFFSVSFVANDACVWRDK